MIQKRKNILHFTLILLMLAPLLTQCQSSSSDGGGLSTLGSVETENPNDEPAPEATPPVNEEDTDDELFANCEELYKNGNNEDGWYDVWPSDEIGRISVLCDMKNGGWTGITPDLAKNKFKGEIAVEIGDNDENNKLDRYFSSDNQPICKGKKKQKGKSSIPKDTTCYYTFQLGFEISEFYLSSYEIKAIGKKKKTLKIKKDHHQKKWDVAWSGYGENETPSSGDVSFGNADGVATSFGEHEKNISVKVKKTYKWTQDGIVYPLPSKGQSFRIGWGNSGGDNNAGWWYPWWSGVIYVR